MGEFEVFDRRRMMGASWRRTARTVTVYCTGKIAFSSAAMDTLGHPAAVAYLVSDGSRVLGFRPAEAGSPGTFRVSGEAHTASAGPVLRYLGADLSASRRYPLADHDGTWCIDLAVPGEPVSYRTDRG